MTQSERLLREVEISAALSPHVRVTAPYVTAFGATTYVTQKIAIRRVRALAKADLKKASKKMN